MLRFDSEKDLLYLESLLQDVSLDQQRQILSLQLKIGLILLPWYIPFRKSEFMKDAVSKGVFQIKDDAVRQEWNHNITHIIHGKDKTKQNPVGGYNEIEFEIFCDIVRTVTNLPI